MLRLTSPERRWRAALLLLPAAWFGWRTAESVNPAAGGVVAAVILSLAILVMRSCLIVTGDGITDRRALRTVTTRWDQVAGFRVGRPSGPLDGFCVIAELHDGSEVDLLATRAYSWAPSARHVDEVQRICWTLQEQREAYGQDLTSA